jgi:YD repeat-containing protein
MICFLLSCKKKESVSSSTSRVPLIKTISTNSAVIIEYWYDNQGRMTCSREVNDKVIDSTVYTYGNDSVERRFYENKTLAEVEHGTLENGDVTFMSGNKTDSTSFWKTYYTYDQNGFLIREIHMDNDTVETWRIEYQIQNNNIITINRINYIPAVYSYEFYPGTTNSLGIQEKYGPYFGKSNSNLSKKCTITLDLGTAVQNNSYDFFDNGWVKKMTSITGTDTIQTYYTYW